MSVSSGKIPFVYGQFFQANFSLFRMRSRRQRIYIFDSYNRREFPETVRELGQKFGIDVPESGPSAEPHAAQSSRLEPLNRAVTA